MKNIVVVTFIIFFFISTKTIPEEIECQGAELRVLNKDTTEKSSYVLPLSQTLEINNTKLIVHRCLKVNFQGIQDEVALISHEFFGDKKSKNDFFGWIFKSTHYMNSPHNPTYDIRLQSCLDEDPIFLKETNY